MQKVTVSASRSYDILIGPGLLAALGQEAAKFPKVKTVCIVSETNVYPLHGPAAEKSMKDAGFDVVSYVFPAGEESKCGETYLKLLNFLAEHRLTRSDLLAALAGGGVGEPRPSHHDGGAGGGGLRGADDVRRGRFRSGRGRRGPPRGLSCCCSLHHLFSFCPCGAYTQRGDCKRTF